MNSRSLAIPLSIALLAALIFEPSPSSGQSVVTNAGGAQTLSDYSIVQQGPHSRVWQNSSGQSVTEIATGLNFWSGSNWTPSVAAFEVSPDQKSFIAEYIQSPTTLAAQINVAGAVSVTTPENVVLRSTPIAIGLYDAASGKSVLIASITNSTGVLTDPQHVVYNKALLGAGISASVVYSLPDAGSFHQDIVFTALTSTSTQPIGDSLNAAQIYSNTLSEGTTFHVQLTATNSFGWFLRGNTYVDTNMNIMSSPFLDPLSPSAHIVH